MSIIKIERKTVYDLLVDEINAIQPTKTVEITVVTKQNKTFEVFVEDLQHDHELYEALEKLALDKLIEFVDEKTNEDGLLVKVYRDLTCENYEDIEEFSSYEAYKESVEGSSGDSEIESQIIEIEEKDDELDEEAEEVSEEETDHNHNQEEASV